MVNAVSWYSSFWGDFHLTFRNPRLYPIVPSTSGKACQCCVVVSADSHLLRESIHPATFPNPDPNDKAFYIPAGTKYVCLALVKIIASLALSELDILSSWCIDEKISGDLMVSPPSTSCHRSCTRYAADEFDPDRFLDERVKKYLVNNSFIFLPFNAGPRICLGQQVRLLFIVPKLFWWDCRC